jgi:hypothetical protein
MRAMFSIRSQSTTLLLRLLYGGRKLDP